MKNITERTSEDWIKILRAKTSGNFLIGFLMGVAFMIALFALAIYF